MRIRAIPQSTSPRTIALLDLNESSYDRKPSV